MFNEQRYEIAKETIQSFKVGTRLTDIKILLTKEEAKRLNNEEHKLLEGLNFQLDTNESSDSAILNPYFVSKC